MLRVLYVNLISGAQPVRFEQLLTVFTPSSKQLFLAIAAQKYQFELKWTNPNVHAAKAENQMKAFVTVP